MDNYDIVAIPKNSGRAFVYINTSKKQVFNMINLKHR